jgi:hypothetical protein
MVPRGPQRRMKMGPRWRSRCSRVGDRSRVTLALAEPAYEYGWDAEKHNEL